MRKKTIKIEKAVRKQYVVTEKKERRVVAVCEYKARFNVLIEKRIQGSN